MKKSIQVTWLWLELTSIQCSHLQPQSPPRYGSGTGSMPFPQAPAGVWWILGGWQRSGWLWCCGRSCWWCSRRMTKRSSPAGSGQGRWGASERRVQSRSTPSEAKPWSLWTCGPAPSPAATPRVCHRPHDCTRRSHTLQHIQVHFGVDFQADFEDLRWHDVALTWNHTKDHNRSQKLCFHHPWPIPVIRGNPDLHFEGAGNGPVVITWIGREHEFYSGASPISLIEHCVTFRHDRRLLSLLGFVHNWATSRWSATKKENWFSLNGNRIMLSFLEQQFYRSTLYMKLLSDFGVSWYIFIFLLVTSQVKSDMLRPN